MAHDCLAGCFSSAPDTLCVGVTNSFSFVPPVSATSYSWTLNSDSAGTSLVGVTNTDTVQVVSTGAGNFSIQCTVTSGTNFLTCATNVTVLSPLALAPLTNQTVCPSSSVVFATVASGAGPFAFQWKKDGSSIVGATTGTLSLASVLPADTGTYSIEVGGPCGSATNAAALVVTAPPTIICPTNMALNCLGDLPAPDTNAVIVDPPSPVIYFGSVTAISNCLTTVTRVYQIVSSCGNTSTCEQVFQIQNTNPPVITCATNRSVECGSNWTFDAPVITDACGGTNVAVTVETTTNQFTGLTFSATRTWHVSDSCSNTASCSQTITVVVTTPPQVFCPSNIVAECNGTAGTPVSFTVTALGLCDTNVTVISTPPSGSLFQLGTNTVTSTASDEYGNSNTCSFTIIVQDTTPPQITCPAKINVAELPHGSGSALVSFAAPVATDLCDGLESVSSLPASGSFFPIGSNTVTSTASDHSGNTNSCTFIVRVIPYHLVVTSADDDGPGSLRQAIRDANDAPGENLITFSLSDSNFSTIHLTAALPEIISPLIIDGTPGGTNLTPAIALDGGGGSNAFDGLVISAGNSTVRGLALNGFATAIRLIGTGINIVQGNFIGSDLSSTNFPGNSGDGIFIDSSRNLIGGGTNGLGNLIVNNGQNGITVNSGIRNALLENIILSNGALGIDLGNDGVTLNDDGDVDTGPNDLQNFPVLTDAQSADGTTTIYGTLTSDVNQNFRVEFYLNDAADPTGYGEGQQYIGATVVGVHNGGPDAFTASFPVTATFTQFITAIATDQRGNSSEFSQAVQVRTPPVLGQQPVSTNAPIGGSATFCAEVSGTPPIFYQWRLNGVNIPGATNSCYTIPDAEVGNIGSYSVIVGNALGAIGTETASLGVPLPELNGADYFSNRVALTGLSGTVEGNNDNATFELLEPHHAGKIGGKSVWYSWIAPVTGVANFRTVGSTFNTLLGVYTGTNVTNLVVVAGDVDHGGFYTSSARFNVLKSREYKIAIDGFGGAEGEFVLGWEEEDTLKLLPAIAVQPVSQTVLPGSDVTFSVQAQRVCGFGVTNCPTPAHYPGDELPLLTNQWYFNGTPIAGATSSSLTISNVQPVNLGAYRMRVFTPWQFLDSQDAILQINLTGSDVQDVQAFDKLLDSELSDALHIGVPPGVAGRGTGSGVGPLGGSSVVRGFTGTQIFNTTGSATSPGETICGVIGGASEWITFVADTSGTLFLTTDGSSYDTVMAVFRRSATNANVLEQIVCDNNGGVDGKDSALNFPVQAGNTNYIVVDGVNGVTGILQLNYSLVTSTVIKLLGTTAQGQQHLQVVGRTNLNFTLQSSSNMQIWNSLFTTNAPTGVFDYVDPTSAGQPVRYYRAILLP